MLSAAITTAMTTTTKAASVNVIPGLDIFRLLADSDSPPIVQTRYQIIASAPINGVRLGSESESISFRNTLATESRCILVWIF